MGVDQTVYFSHFTELIPADTDLRLTFQSKSEGDIEATVVIEIAVATSIAKQLSPNAAWHKETVAFHSQPSLDGKVGFYLRFEVKGTGKLWLDDFQLSDPSHPATHRVQLWTPADTALLDPLRAWAATEYWSSAADDALAYLLGEAKAINPVFEFFSNGFHAKTVTYSMTERAFVPDRNAHRLEQRGDVGYYPGTYTSTGLLDTTQVVVSNAFCYKYIHSLRRSDHFVYHMPWWDAPLGQLHNPDSVLLQLGECAAFGGGAGNDPGLRYNYFNYNETQTAAIRAVERRFWRFVHDHEALYAGYRTYADVGIVFHDPPVVQSPTYGIDEFIQLTDLAKELGGRGVLWDVLTENRCDLSTFTRCAALIYQDVTRISETEIGAVQQYLEAGGLVIAAKIVGDEDQWFRMRLPDSSQAWPPVGLPPMLPGGRPRPAALEQQVGTGTLIYEPGPLSAKTVVDALLANLGRTIELVTPLLRINGWIRNAPASRIVLHLLNYAVPLGIENGGKVQPLSDVDVSCPLPGSMNVTSVRIYSPEVDGAPEPVSFEATDGIVTFTIPTIRVYSLAVIE